MTQSPPVSIPLYRRAQQWLLPVLQHDGLFVDATCGNGNDTLFLCQSATSASRIVAIDKQPTAIIQTRELLRQNGCQADLYEIDHARIGTILDAIGLPIAGALFNLGYLPKGDHSIITTPVSTLEAIRTLFARFSPKFRLSIVAYRGHPGGAEEEEAVRKYLKNLDFKRFEVIEDRGGSSPSAPVFYGIEGKI